MVIGDLSKSHFRGVIGTDSRRQRVNNRRYGIENDEYKLL